MNGAAFDASAGVIVQTKNVIRAIFPVIVVCALATTMLGLAAPDMAAPAAVISVVSTLLGAVVVHAALLSMVSGEGVVARGAPGLALSGPASLFVAAWALPYVVLDLLGAILGLTMGEDTLIAPILTVVAGVLFLHFLAKYGTVYPALVDGGDLSLGMAARRAQVDKVFWRLLGAFLFGMGLVFVIVLVAPLALLLIGGAGGGLGAAMVDAMNSFFMTFLAACVFLCVSVAMAVILCNAYRGAYADPSS